MDITVADGRKSMLSQRIRELRVAQGYSQVTLAKRLGVSKQAVSNWENDNIQPSIEMLLPSCFRYPRTICWAGRPLCART